MLKFLVDESSGKKLAEELSVKGYDVVYVGDVLKEALDHAVLDAADKQARILITNDKDFGELVFRQLKPSSGVILLRLKTDTPESRIKCTATVIKRFGEKLSNSFTVVSEESIRLRKRA